MRLEGEVALRGASKLRSSPHLRGSTAPKHTSTTRGAPGRPPRRRRTAPRVLQIARDPPQTAWPREMPSRLREMPSRFREMPSRLRLRRTKTRPALAARMSAQLGAHYTQHGAAPRAAPPLAALPPPQRLAHPAVSEWWRDSRAAGVRGARPRPRTRAPPGVPRPAVRAHSPPAPQNHAVPGAPLAPRATPARPPTYGAPGPRSLWCVLRPRGARAGWRHSPTRPRAPASEAAAAPPHSRRQSPAPAASAAAASCCRSQAAQIFG